MLRSARTRRTNAIDLGLPEHAPPRKRSLATKPFKRWIKTVLIYVTIAGSAIALVGLHDLVLAEGIPYRIGGLLLLGLGAGLAASALILNTNSNLTTKEKERTTHAAFSLCVIGIVLGVIFITAVYFDMPYEWRLRVILLLAILTILASISVAIIFDLSMLFAKSAASEWRMFSSAPRTLASLGGIGALIAGAQFLHGSLYSPSLRAPQISVTAQISNVRAGEKSISFNCSIKVRNDGDTKSIVLGSLYTIGGATVAANERGSEYSDLEPPIVAGAVAVSRNSKYFHVSSPTLLQFGSIFQDGTWFEPGQELTTTFLGYVPKEKFDLLRLTTDFWFAKGDKFRIDLYHPEGPSPPPFESFSGTRAMLFSWPVKEPSLFRKITSAPLRAYTLRITPMPGESEVVSPPSIQVFLERVGHLTENGMDMDIEQQVKLHLRYQIAFTGSLTELTLSRVARREASSSPTRTSMLNSSSGQHRQSRRR